MPNLPLPEMLVKHRGKHHNEKKIDKMKELTRMLLVGKTQAGSAEVQPARDSRLKATNCRWGSSYTSAIPFYDSQRQFRALLCLKNLIKKSRPRRVPYLAEGKESLLTKKWFCPIHAEPVHFQQITPYRFKIVLQQCCQRNIFFVSEVSTYHYKHTPTVSCVLYPAIGRTATLSWSSVFLKPTASVSGLGWSDKRPLHNDATVGAIYTTHRINKVNQDAPERDKLKATNR